MHFQYSYMYLLCEHIVVGHSVLWFFLMMADRESPLDGNMSGYSMESLAVAHSG